MRYIIIRNQKTDSFTMHSTTCRVAMRHYEDSPGLLTNDECTHTTVEASLAYMAEYASECGWNEAPKVKVCNCAKV